MAGKKGGRGEGGELTGSVVVVGIVVGRGKGKRGFEGLLPICKTLGLFPREGEGEGEGCSRTVDCEIGYSSEREYRTGGKTAREEQENTFAPLQEFFSLRRAHLIKTTINLLLDESQSNLECVIFRFSFT